MQVHLHNEMARFRTLSLGALDLVLFISHEHWRRPCGIGKTFPTSTIKEGVNVKKPWCGFCWVRSRFHDIRFSRWKIRIGNCKILAAPMESHQDQDHQHQRTDPAPGHYSSSRVSSLSRWGKICPIITVGFMDQQVGRQVINIRCVSHLITRWRPKMKAWKNSEDKYGVHIDRGVKKELTRDFPFTVLPRLASRFTQPGIFFPVNLYETSSVKWLQFLDIRW